jgi:N-methylhydantoinase A
MDIEITVWAVNATTRPEEVERINEATNSEPSPISGTRDIFDPALGERVEASIIQRGEMQTGATATGPCAITEDETTIIIPSSREAIRQPDGCIDMFVKS